MMAFDRSRANTTGPVVRGLYSPSTQNPKKQVLLEITANRLALSFSPIVRSVATPQRHIIIHYIT